MPDANSPVRRPDRIRLPAARTVAFVFAFVFALLVVIPARNLLFLCFCSSAAQTAKRETASVYLSPCLMCGLSIWVAAVLSPALCA